MEARLKGCLMESKGVIIELGERLRVGQVEWRVVFLKTNNIDSFTVSSLYLVTFARHYVGLSFNFIPPDVCTK